MKVKIFSALLLFSSCSWSRDENRNNPFYDPNYCDSTFVDSNDYCRNRYPKPNKPPLVIAQPKEDSKDVPAKQPDSRSESSKTSSPKENNSRSRGD